MLGVVDIVILAHFRLLVHTSFLLFMQVGVGVHVLVGQ